jgi:cellulose/xylan binding protein with CBM9 domain
MRKYFFASILTAMFFGHGCATNDKLQKLTPPPAPFEKSDSSAKAVKPDAKIAGREIIFGSKKLIVTPSGAMVFMSNGRNLCELYFYVNTEWSSFLTNIDRGKAPAKWKKGSVGIIESSYDKAKNQFIIKGNFPLNKPKSGVPAEGQFVETVTLLDSGKVKIENQYIIPEKYKKLFRSTCMFLQCSGVDNFSIAGKKYTFEEKTRHFFKPPKIHFAQDNITNSFDVDVLSTAMISATKRKGKEDFRIYPRKTNKISFILDPGKVSADSMAKESNAYAGVDFKKTDDLEVPNYSICRNLIQNPSFEQGVMYCITNNHFDDFLGINGIEADDSEALFGKHSLKVNLYKSGYNIYFSPVPVEPGKYIFSFYVKGDGSEKQKMSSHIQNASRAQLSRKYWAVGKEWKRIFIPFEIKKTTAFSCRLAAAGNDGSVVHLDGLQLEKGDKATDFVSPPVEGLLLTSKEDNFFSPEEKIDASLRILSVKPETSGKVKVTVKDFFSSKIFDEEYSFKTGKDGVALVKLPFDDKFSKGIYIVKADYMLDNGQRLHNFFRFSIMPYLENKHKLKTMFSNAYHGQMKRQVYPGLETYLKRCRDIGAGGETHSGFVSKDFAKLLNKYGIEIINSNMSGPLMKGYKKVSDAKGRKFFGLYNDKGWRKGAKLFIKDFRVEGDGKLTDEYLKRFEKAVIGMVKEYPWIPRWAFAGECWAKWPEWMTNDMESFANLQIAFYKAVKKANPKLKVYNGDPCNIYPEGGTKRLKKVLDEINGRIKYDALAIHSYLPDGPDSLEANMEAFFDMGKEFGYTDTPTFYPEGMHYGPYNIPQWGTVSASWGPPRTWYYGTLSYDMGWTEKLSAAWFARSWLICMKFMDRVISADAAATNMISNFHLDAKLTPRAYQKIPNTLGRLLGNSSFVEDVSFAPDTKCLIFEDGKKRPVAAVWGKIQKVDRGLETCPLAMAKFDGGKVEIFDLMETRRAAKKDAKGNIRFPVSTFPFFIRGKAGTRKSFSEALRNAKMLGGNLIPLKMLAKVAGPDTVELVLSNQISREVKGSIIALGLKENIDIPPRKKVSFKIKMQEALSANKITEVKVPVTVSEKGSPEPLKKDVCFESFLCKKTQSSIKIDGNEDDWKNIPAIPLKNRTIGGTTGEKTGYKGDFDGSFKVAWDKGYLYLMVKIQDDMFTHKAFKNTAQRWNNDSLQIYIDTKCDARDRKHHGYDANDYDYAVFPDKDGKATTFRYRSPDQQLTLGTEAPDDRTTAKYIPSAFKKTSDGYIYEVAFPSKYLLPIKLENNYVLGFSLFVNDRDKGKQTKQALTLTPS